MATFKLKTSGVSGKAPPSPARSPVRGAGAGVQGRPTLAQAQSRRAEQEARYQEQLRQRFGDRPPASFTQRGDGPPARRNNPAFEPRPAPRTTRGAPPDRDPRSMPAFDAPRRNEPRNDARQAPRFEPRNDPRNSPRNSPRNDPRNDARDAPRFEPRTAPRGDPGSAPRHDPRHDPRGAPRGEPRHESRPGPRSDAPRFDPRNAAPVDLRNAPRFDPRAASRPDPRNARRADPHHAPRPARRSFNENDRDDADDPQEPTPHAPGSLRLSKRMSELGIASRREADEWIAKGWVRVDDQVVSELGSRVLPGQRVTVDAKAKFQQAQRVTVLVNKPVGYVSGQAEDGYEPAFVLVTPANLWQEDHSGTRFLREHLKNLVPAGRLDIDSVGLLVLTQDGRIAKQLIGEGTEIEKEYLVRVAMPGGATLPEASLALLREGLELDGEALLPARVEWVNEHQLRFVLRQGKKRQIRRMCEAVGLQVLGLKRVRVGQVMLGDLPTGQWRYLRADETFG